jgi:hypothetical protein
MNLKSLIIGALLFIVPIISHSQTTVTIGGGGTITCPNVPTATWTTPPSGVTFSNWSRGSGVTCASSSDGLSGSGFNTTSYTASHTSNKFFRFTLTTNSITSVRVSALTWLTTVSSGGANFTIAYQNAGGPLTQFGSTLTNPITNSFTGTVTIAPSTSCIFFLIPSGTNSSTRTVRLINGSTITLNPVPVINTSGSLSSRSTVYGTPSTSTSFSVSGTNLTGGITITPPSAYEVSTSNTFATVGTSTSPLIIGTSGTVSSTTIFVRLRETAVPGTYNSQSITLTATNATTRIVNTASSGNIVSTKALTISSPSVVTKTYDGTNTATIVGTLTGTIGTDVVTFIGSGTFSSVNAGTGISVTSSATLSGTHASRYTLTQPTGLLGNITKANQTISFEQLPYKSSLDLPFAPIASATSNLPLIVTSSNSSVASILSGEIQINGIGTTTITISQGGDGNWNPATSVSQDLIIDYPISRWSFETSTVSGIGQTPSISSPSAEIGEQNSNTSFTGFHTSPLTVWTNFVGNGDGRSISADRWTVGDYFQFTLNTKYTTIIRLSFDQNSSATGPKDFRLQWSIDGTNFTNIEDYQIAYNTASNTVYSWTATNYFSQSTLSFDLSTITEINDQSQVFFRLLNTTNGALLGGTVQTAGTSRIDNFSLFGSLDIPLPLQILDFKGTAYERQNFLRWTLSEQISVTVQKYINGSWKDLSTIEDSRYIDSLPERISYYRLVTDSNISKPIYILNSSVEGEEFQYFDLTGRPNETSKILVRKSAIDSKIIIKN